MRVLSTRVVIAARPMRVAVRAVLNEGRLNGYVVRCWDAYSHLCALLHPGRLRWCVRGACVCRLAVRVADAHRCRHCRDSCRRGLCHRHSEGPAFRSIRDAVRIWGRGRANIAGSMPAVACFLAARKLLGSLIFMGAAVLAVDARAVGRKRLMRLPILFCWRAFYIFRGRTRPTISVIPARVDFPLRTS